MRNPGTTGCDTLNDHFTENTRGLKDIAVVWVIAEDNLLQDDGEAVDVTFLQYNDNRNCVPKMDIQLASRSRIFNLIFN